MLLGIVGWIIIGFLLGFVANKLVNLRNEDPGLSIVVGAVAAVLGGWLYGVISGSPITAFNLWSLSFAAVAASLGLLVWHTWRARTSRA